jgi:hypothetical protein
MSVQQSSYALFAWQFCLAFAALQYDLKIRVGESTTVETNWVVL